MNDYKALNKLNGNHLKLLNLELDLRYKYLNLTVNTRI